jgi:hypothetical protein
MQYRPSLVLTSQKTSRNVHIMTAKDVEIQIPASVCLVPHSLQSSLMTPM